MKNAFQIAAFLVLSVLATNTAYGSLLGDTIHVYDCDPPDPDTFPIVIELREENLELKNTLEMQNRTKGKQEKIILRQNKTIEKRDTTIEIQTIAINNYETKVKNLEDSLAVYRDSTENQKKAYEELEDRPPETIVHTKTDTFIEKVFVNCRKKEVEKRTQEKGGKGHLFYCGENQQF